MRYNRLLISLLVPLALALAAVPLGATQAAQPTAPSVVTITVNDPADVALSPLATRGCDVDPLAFGPQCTLRAAIQFANRLTQPVVIAVPAGVYSLTIVGANEDAGATGDLDITRTVTINGAGAGSTLIQWDPNITPTLRDRIFHIIAGDVSLSGVTLQHAGFPASNTGDGGAIRVNAGASLTLMHSVIADTSATVYGGAILNEGTLTVFNSTLTGGFAHYGGAIKSDGPLTLNNVSLGGNVAAFSGGALYAGDLSASSVSVVGNRAGDAGGGLALFGTVTMSNTNVMSNVVTDGPGGGLVSNFALTVTNSSIVANSADQVGGGIVNNGALALINATIGENNARLGGGGLWNSGIASANNLSVVNNTTVNGTGGGIAVAGTLTMKNSIVAGNHNPTPPAIPDCAGTLISLGYNLIQDTTGCTITGTTTGNLTGVDPQLGALRRDANGTYTHAPLFDSRVIDAGSPSAPGSADACAATDQRGVSRPQDGDDDGAARCDIGAVEVARFVVNTSNDALLNPGSVACETAPASGVCTLRAAVEASNHLNGPDVIVVPSGIYTLSLAGADGGCGDDETTGDLDLHDDVRIAGAGAASTIIQWDASIAPTMRDRLFDIPWPYSITARIGGLTLRNGVANQSIICFAIFGGGGISNGRSSLTLDDVRVIGNVTSGQLSNGGIANGGTLLMNNSVVSDNVAFNAGGIYSSGRLAMDNSSVNQNTSRNTAGGIYNDNGVLVINNSVVSNNTANRAGGIYGYGGTLSISGSSITGNRADSIAGIGGGLITITNSIINDNHAVGPNGGYGGGIAAIAANSRLVLISSTVSNNTASGPYFFGGGGILGFGSVELLNSRVVSNTAAAVGGGISLYFSALTATNSLISGNAASTDGGGMYVFTTTPGLNLSVNLSNVTLGDNIADRDGGGIWNAQSLLIANSTLSNNRALDGGGIANLGVMTATNSTLSGNSARDDGGGLYVLTHTAQVSRTSVSLNNVTMSDNTADSDGDGVGNGGGVFINPTATVTMQNTLIAANHDNSPNIKNPDCFNVGTFTSQGYSLLGADTNCSLLITAGKGDLVGTAANPIDPKLGPLQNNGGPTPTQALLPGSPAVDAGNPAGCTDANGNLLTSDQRGFARPFGPRCDIGAFEFAPLRLFLPLIVR